MIPRILQIKNFLSYSAQIQTLDFTNYSLICLSGKNGHGKSALLDAITWALWGQARKAQGLGKPDEGLIRMGQNNLFVSFEFQVGQSIYRVRREFFKGHGRAISGLEFQIFDQEADQFKTLTDKTIGLTQEKIEACLGLDFETFLNTSFFSQGRSNEFSKKTPKERKQILSGIIGLGKYDQMSSKAQELGRLRQDELNKISALQEAYRKEVSELAQLEQKLLEANSRLDQFKLLSSQLNKKSAQLNTEFELINALLAMKSDLEKKRAELISLIKKWREINQTVVQAPNLIELARQKELLQKKQYQLVCDQNLYIENSKECFSLKNKISEIERQILLSFEAQKTCQLQVIQEKRFELKNFEKELELIISRKKTAQDKIFLLDRKINETKFSFHAHSEIELVVERLKKKHTRLLSFKEFVLERARSNREDLLASQENLKEISNSAANAACPTCGQAISSQLSQKMGYRLSGKINLLKAHNLKLKRAFDLIEPTLEKIEFSIKEQDSKIAQKQSLVASLEALTHEFSGLEAELLEIDKQVGEQKLKLSQAGSVLETLEADFKANFDETVLQSKLLADIELGALKVQHLNILKKMELNERSRLDLEDVLVKIDLIEKKILCASNIDSERRAQCVRRENIESSYTDISSNYKKFGSKINSVDQRLTELNQFKDQILTEQAFLEAKVQEVLQEIGSFKQEIARVNNLATQLKETEAISAQIKQEIDDYSTLAGAFGKNGVQALIIEGLIPEIESEANKIMANLSEEQTKIFIEPLKDLKKGGYKESLDIKISDSSGTRPYEMFSGGEAFRIDFALRISISKLLARRAGANLQTLIIDEGFGSQDQEGIARLMEAINSVRADFSKIIVVSHLQELKNEFPVHFLVTKYPTGSIVKIEYRG